MVWMIFDGHIITGNDCGSNFLTFVLRLRGKLGNTQEIDPIGDRTLYLSNVNTQFTHLTGPKYLSLVIVKGL